MSHLKKIHTAIVLLSMPLAIIGCKTARQNNPSDTISTVQDIAQWTINGARITGNSVVNVNVSQKNENGDLLYVLYTITLNAVNSQAAASDTDLIGQSTFGDEAITDRAILLTLRNTLAQSPQGKGTAHLGVRYLDIQLKANEPNQTDSAPSETPKGLTTTNPAAVALKASLESKEIRRVTYLEGLKEILMGGNITYAYFKSEKALILRDVGHAEVIVTKNPEALKLQADFNRDAKSMQRITAYLETLKQLHDAEKINSDFYDYEKQRALDLF